VAIFCIAGLSANDSFFDSAPANGFFILRANTVVIPLECDRIISTRTVYSPNVYILSNYINGKKEGVEICHVNSDSSDIVYTAHYSNDVLNGSFEFQPNSRFNVKCSVKNGGLTVLAL
jgi:hypothetical protein